MTDKNVVAALLERAGNTYADDAGIRVTDKPAPLYRLLLLSVLLSTRIKADIAVAAAAELVRAGMGTPARMRAAPWQDRVDALGRAHYKRYDESTATALGEGADLLHAEYDDDLRPTLDGKALDGAKRLGLPTTAADLADLVPPSQLARLASALVRVALDSSLAEEVRAA